MLNPSFKLKLDDAQGDISLRHMIDCKPVYQVDDHLFLYLKNFSNLPVMNHICSLLARTNCGIYAWLPLFTPSNSF